MNAPYFDLMAGKPAVDLVRVAPFRLGTLDVEPAMCRVRARGAEVALEPRVMQVLVALVEADGDVVSRNELVARCWAGRVVGEAAINRVVSRIRAVAGGVAEGSFAVETINKVGYRLVADAARVGQPLSAPLAAAAVEPQHGIDAVASVASIGDARRPSSTRRRIVVGALGTLLVATGGAVAWRRSRSQPPPEAEALFRKGVEAQRQGLAEQNVQAAAYFRQAVAVDDRYAAAWGALALAYRHLLETGRPEDDPATTAEWVRSAAARAFELDPRNADARVALILIKPYFRNLAVLDAEIRDALRDHPDHWLLWGNLGRILGEAGRWSDAVAPLQRAIAIDPFLPLSRARLAITLWAAGRLHDAEAAFDEAAARWPAHPSIWFPRFHFLAFSGRTSAAIALSERADARPLGVSAADFNTLTTLAKALDSASPPAAGGDPIERAAAAVGTGTAVQYLTRLGRVDAAFARMDAYFAPADSGAKRPEGSSLMRRYTDFLFLPPTAALQADPRFASLTAAVGLDDYWRRAGAAPDGRRAGRNGTTGITLSSPLHHAPHMA